MLQKNIQNYDLRIVNNKTSSMSTNKSQLIKKTDTWQSKLLKTAEQMLL